MVKISIITVSLNAAQTIEKTIRSVISQDYPNIQYILIDGKSTDDTLKIAEGFADHIQIIKSEKDNGLYDAINKGILLADGDIIGFLNADDVFKDEQTVLKIANAFNKDRLLDSVIGDIAFVNEAGDPVRYYSARKWSPSWFRFGMMPPHPSFYCRREFYLKFGLYRTDFKIGADFELMLRFLKINQISYKYLPALMVLMKPGGISTKGLSSLVIINREIIRATRLNHLYTNYLIIFLRYFLRVFQLFLFDKKKIT